MTSGSGRLSCLRQLQGDAFNLLSEVYRQELSRADEECRKSHEKEYKPSCIFSWTRQPSPTNISSDQGNAAWHQFIPLLLGDLMTVYQKSSQCQGFRPITAATMAKAKPSRPRCSFIGCWFAFVSANLERGLSAL
ncbi:unnamed protein product [Boreogadus saida]